MEVPRLSRTLTTPPFVLEAAFPHGWQEFEFSSSRHSFTLAALELSCHASLPHSLTRHSAMEQQLRNTTELMSCQSCGQWRGTSESEPWYCDDCFKVDRRTKEEMDRRTEELEDKISFLTVTNPHQIPPDLDLIVKDDSEGTPSAPIPTHKLMLADRSPVFKAMLGHPMEESQSGKIIIEGVSYEAVKCFVNYLYSGFVSLDEDLALKLLALAERYEVMRLKKDCENFLVSKLTWDNSILSYKFAHMHNAKFLLKATASLIKDNLAVLRKHPHFRPLAEENPALALEILEVCFLEEVERNAAVST